MPCDQVFWSDPLESVGAALPSRLQRALGLLRESGPRRVRLDELSRSAGITKYHLSRLFARHLGTTPHRFQLRRRLALAAGMLKAGRRPVDIAGELGFTDPAHLSKSFKRTFGVTPSQYALGQVPACNSKSATPQ